MSKTFIKKALVLAAMLCLVAGMNGQGPGYMGKCVAAGYGFYGNPAFAGLSSGYTKNILNAKHEFFLEYAVSNSVLLGLSVQLYKTTFENSLSVKIPQPNSSAYGLSQSAYNPSGNYVLRGTNVALYAKFFKRRYIAPWGRYFMLGLSLNKYTATYDPSVMQVPTVQTRYTVFGYSYKYVAYSDFGDTDQSYQMPDLSIGWGKTRILANRVVIDYGYNINVLATTLTVFDFLKDDESELRADEYIAQTSKLRMRGVNRFNFFCKLGYLF